MKTRKIYVIKYFQLKVKFCTGNWLKYFIFCCKIYLIYFPISFIALFPTCRTGPRVSAAWMWVVQCTVTSSSSVLLPCQAVPLTHVWTLSIRGSVLSVLSSTGLAWSAANTWSPVTAATTLQPQSMSWSWRYNYQICPGHALVMINPKWTIIVTLRQNFFEFCYYLLRSGISQNQEQNCWIAMFPDFQLIVKIIFAKIDKSENSWQKLIK